MGWEIIADGDPGEPVLGPDMALRSDLVRLIKAANRGADDGLILGFKPE